MSGNPLSLYFHIPFCSQKCPYCHFFVVKDREDQKDALLEALLLELALRQKELQNHSIVSIYFGGGTPSLFGPGRIQTLLSSLPSDCEITLEANPEDVTSDLMKSYVRAGINRVSLGLQSLQDDALITLGRTHTANKAIQAVEMTHDAGIENISIDLMYELPDQDLASFESTLKQIEKLPINHLSLYNLTIEPHTPFSKKKLNLPSQETGLKMLQSAILHIESIGLKRYEISAFARSGKESVHNTGYWKARPFFGLGPSAFSFYGGARFQNVCNLKKYCDALQNGHIPTDFEEKLPYPQNVHELLAVRLRLVEGVKLEDFSLPKTTNAKLIQLREEGLLEQREDRLCLSERGLLFYDTVASELI